MQFFDAKAGVRADFEVLYFTKEDAGWLWTWGGAEGGAEDGFQELVKWAEGGMDAWKNRWAGDLLREVALMDKGGLEEGGWRDVVEEEATIFAKRWLEALQERDFKRISEMSAMVRDDRQDEEDLLRTLAFEVSHGATSERKLDELILKDGWAAMVVSYELQGETVRNFVPLLMVQDRLRFFPEFKFVLGGGRTKDFLNDEAFRGLAKMVGRERLKPLRVMFRELKEDDVGMGGNTFY